MWDDGRAGDVDLAPRATGDGSVMTTFGRWYIDWLNEAEQTVFKTRR